MGDAACANTDPELFMPDPGGSPRKALKICNGDGRLPPCEVREDCLLYALAHKERYGIWGGKTAQERARMSFPDRGRSAGKSHYVA
jgi:WhiB family redox-sensing transcriptional regulator